MAAAAVVFAVGVDPEVGFLGVLKVGGWSVLGATAGLVRIRSTKERVMSVRHRRLAVAGVIAATAIANELPLYTCNEEDFAGIDDLTVVAVPHPLNG